MPINDSQNEDQLKLDKNRKSQIKRNVNVLKVSCLLLKGSVTRFRVFTNIFLRYNSIMDNLLKLLIQVGAE